MSQQSKSTLQSAINTQLADNTSGDISAADVRDNLINMTDSLLFNNETTQTLTGALTVTAGITGSLEGTSTTASYVETAQTASYVLTASYAIQALSASWAPSTGGSTFPYNGAAQITGSLSISGSLTQQGDNINLGIPDSLGNRNIKFTTSGQNEVVLLAANDGPSTFKSKRIQLDGANGISVFSDTTTTFFSNQTILSGSVLFEKAITSSLQGTATTASYVETAQTASYVENAVSASYATVAETLLGSVTSASYAATASYIPVAQTLVNTNLPLVLINGNSLVKDQYESISYNPANNVLNIVAYTNFTGSITSQDSILSTGGFTGSLQGTASYATTSATASYVEGSNVNGYVDLANNTDQIYINSTFYSPEDLPIVFSSIAINNYGAIQNDIQNFRYNPVTNRLTLSGSQVITGSLDVTGGITGSVYVPYKEYTVLLTYAPAGGIFTVNSLTNTLGTITWNDPTPGVFTATKANAFPNESKVYISPTFVGSGADIYALTGIVSNTNVIEFTITKLSDSTSNSSPFLLLIPITIKVYD